MVLLERVSDSPGLPFVLMIYDAWDCMQHCEVLRNRFNDDCDMRFMREIPIGIQDFKKLRDLDLYFVDKSWLVDRIVGRGKEVFLFTRPRRFGKSLNLSMLDAYLNREYAGNTWFDGLEISRIRPDDPEKNANTVVYLDLKDVGDGTYEDFLRKIELSIAMMYDCFSYLVDSDVCGPMKKRFMDIYDQSEDADYSQALQILIFLLGKHHGSKVIVLIDEYDNAMNNARDDVNRKRILDFLRSLLGGALKGNEFLKFAVVTGVMKVGRESIFSGLNNLYTNSVFSTEFDEAFGFTGEEVRKLCEYYGHPDRFDEARMWYDGYRFGDADVYNPWSILNYVSEGFRPGPYWASTSGNDIIENLVDGLGTDIYEDFRKIVAGDGVTKHISDTVVYSDISDGGEARDLFSVMIMSGYLSAIPTGEVGEYRLRIPNKEVSGVFEDRFLRRMGRTGQRIRELAKAVVSGDAVAVADSFGGLAMSIDPKVMSHEHAYEILCISLLMYLEGPYRILNEIHAGNGYCDILLESRRSNLPHVLLELKRKRNDGGDVDALAESGLKQIHEKSYTRPLSGRVLLYGIAFDGSKAAVKTESVVL